MLIIENINNKNKSNAEIFVKILIFSLIFVTSFFFLKLLDNFSIIFLVMQNNFLMDSIFFPSFLILLALFKFKSNSLFIAFIAFMYGFYGFYLSFNVNDFSISAFHQSLIQSLQLFVLNVAPTEMKNSLIQYASVIAPISTATAIGAAIQNYIGYDWRITNLHLRSCWPLKELLTPYCDIVWGGNANAMAVVRRLALGTEHSKIIVVCPSADSPLSQALAEQSIRFNEQISGLKVITDLHSKENLEKLHISKIKRIWVATDHSEENMQLASMLVNQLKCSQDMIVFVDDLTHADRYSDSYQLNGCNNIHYFNLLGHTARTLLQKCPPPYPLLTDRNGIVHLCIVGDHPFCEALLVDAVRQCVYADSPSRAIRITLIGKTATATLQRVYAHHPLLKPEAQHGCMDAVLPLAYLHAMDAVPNCLQTDDWVIAQLPITQGGFGTFSKIVICETNDTDTHMAAFRVVALQDVCGANVSVNQNVVACVTSELNVPKERPNYQIFDFDDEWWDSTNEGEYPGQTAERSAAIFDAAYGEAYKLIRDPANYKKLNLHDQEVRDSFINNAFNNYYMKPLWQKWSSRCSADHIYVKVALIGLNGNTAKKSDLEAGIQTSLELLSKIEHRRFIVERLIDGWLYVNNSDKNPPAKASGMVYIEQKNKLKLNNTLVPFNELAQQEVLKDEKMVIYIPLALEVRKY